MTTPVPPPQPPESWLSLSLASPTEIRSWSYGRIETAKLFDRNVGRFHDSGLYSERIFGPIRDYECACGRLKGLENYLASCGNCNVSVRQRTVRSERMGHIELPLPVLHPWFHGRNGAPMELLLGLTAHELRDLLDRKRFLDLDHAGPRLRAALRDELAALANGNATLEAFLASSGAGAVQTLLETIDFVALCKLLEDYRDHLKFPGTTSAAQAALFDSPETMPGVVGAERRLDARIEALRRVARGGLIPRNAVLEVLPVIPAGLRVGRTTREGQIRIDPVTARYQRVLRACGGVQDALNELAAAGPGWPAEELCQSLVRSERRLQREIAGLFAELLRGSVARGERRRGERRAFSKRVDFSARAPLVPDPNLPFYACRAPKRTVIDVLVEHFNPDGAIQAYWAVNRLILEAISHPLAFSVNKGASDPATAMFTLHPRPTDDAAVHVHPAVAAAAGRTFDDLSATLHLPLSVSATADCDRLSFPYAALRDPTTGARRLAITADAAVGCYYATWASNDVGALCERLEREFTPWHPKALAFASLDDVYDAWQRGRASLHDPVMLRLPAGQARVRRLGDPIGAPGQPQQLVTTAGRAVLNRLLPAGAPFYDLPFDRSMLNETLDAILHSHGTEAAVRFAEHAWALGLQILTRSGLSFSLADLASSATWNKHLEQLDQQVAKLGKLYDRSLIAYTEHQDSRARAVYDLRQKLIGEQYEALASTPRLSLLRAVLAGQKALSSDAFSRLTGIVGTVWPPDGGRVPLPILSNFSRGIDLHGYFQLAQDGRRRLVRAAKAARAPRQLARRIMSALADVAITIEDCGARTGVEIRRNSSDETGDVFAALLRGRVILHALYHVGRPGTIVEAGELISPAAAAEIVANRISHARVRSPLLCGAPSGVCRRCYGADPATGQLIELGAAVGVKAALAMAPTVHAIHNTTATPPQDPLIISSVQAIASGVASLGDVQTIVHGDRRIVVSTGGFIEIFDENSRPVRQHIPQASDLFVETGSKVTQGVALAVQTQSPRQILAPQAGVVRIERAGRAGRGAFLSLVDAAGAVVDACLLPPDAELQVADGAAVNVGDRLARIPIPYTPRLAALNGRFARLRRLLETRPRRPRALLAEVDGRVELLPEPDRQRTTILLHPPHGGPPAAAHVPWSERRIIVVRTGQAIAVGDPLTWGDVFAGDLVRLRGVDAMRPRLWGELWELLASLTRDRPLDERPWELLLGQMLRCVEIQASGDSRLAVGAVLPRAEVEGINRGLRRMWRISDRRAYPIPLDANVVSQKIYDIAVRAFTAQFPGKPRPPAYRAWPAGGSDRLLGLRELAERGSYLAAGGLRPTRRSLVRAALDRRSELLSQLQHRILAGQRTRDEPM